MVRRALLAAVACTITLVACAPSFSDATAIVTGPRLLAVQAQPAEAATGKSFAMTALYVGPDGDEDPAAIDWAICLAQNPLGDPDPIAPSCFVASSSSLTPLGTGGAVSGMVPSNACELFGPDSPPPAAGQPAARPTDPDATGGFYLPVRVRSDGDQWSGASERIACQPSGLTEQVFTAFSNQYVLNQNPAVASLARVDASGTTTPIAAAGSGSGGGVTTGITVSRGQRVTLEVAWPSCPASPSACGGAESYVYIDPSSKELATARESIVASWYATAGAFDRDRVGRDGTDPALTADNAWTAPGSAGTVRLWVVLRDARGGVGWASYAVLVE